MANRQDEEPPFEESMPEMLPGTVPGIPLKRTLARNTSANAIAQIASAASAFILMPFLIRSFGIGTYGVYVFTSSLSGYLNFLDFGVGLSLTKLLAEYRAKRDDRASGELISSALAFYLGVGVLAAGILLFASRYLIGWFNFTPEEQLVATRLLLVGAAFSPLMWPVLSVSAVQAGLHRYDMNARAALMAVALNAVATISILALHLGPVALVVAISVNGLLVSLWNWREALRGLGASVVLGLRQVSVKAIGPIVKLSAYIFVIQVSTVLIYQTTDRLIVGFFVGAAAVTVYEVAAKIESAVRQLAGLMSSAVVPAASHLASVENAPAMHRLLLKGTRYTVFAIAPIATGLIVLAHPLITEWLGPDLAPAVVPAQVYVSYWLVNANASVLGSMIVGIGRVDRVIWWQNLATALNLGLGIVLTWRFGLIGVILGTVVSHLLVIPIYVRIGFGMFGVSFAEWWREVALPAYPPLVLVVLIALAGDALGLAASLLGVALIGMAAVGSYWLVAYWFILDADEKRDVASLFAAVRGRLIATVGRRS